MAADPVTRAREISDGFLFPTALVVDALDVVPAQRLDRLAEAGFYGLAGPQDAGGLGLPDVAASMDTRPGSRVGDASICSVPRRDARMAGRRSGKPPVERIAGPRRRSGAAHPISRFARRRRSWYPAAAARSTDHHAQRLAREALFLLVFGQTPAIKAAQLQRLYHESHD